MLLIFFPEFAASPAATSTNLNKTWAFMAGAIFTVQTCSTVNWAEAACAGNTWTTTTC